MLLKRMILTNFRQYQEADIEFSTNPEKNVTLILGKNTSGKTTFIQAFRWVLYDDSNFTGEKKDTLVINEPLIKRMQANTSQKCSVQLFVTHNNKDYEIVRELTYHCKTTGTDGKPDSRGSILTIYETNKSGERRNVQEDFNALIARILPENLSNYFFFDGEKISKSRYGPNVENSINSIMGLVPLKKMIEHLKPTHGKGGVIQSLIGERKNDGSTEYESALRKKNFCQKERDGLVDERDTHIKIIEMLEKKMVKLTKIS